MRATTIQSIVSVGLRYLLPVFPLLHVLVSKVATWRFEQKWAKACLAILLGWYVGGTAWLHPHYLAHFNELIGGLQVSRSRLPARIDHRFPNMALENLRHQPV